MDQFSIFPPLIVIVRTGEVEADPRSIPRGIITEQVHSHTLMLSFSSSLMLLFESVLILPFRGSDCFNGNGGGGLTQ